MTSVIRIIGAKAKQLEKSFKSSWAIYRSSRLAVVGLAMLIVFLMLGLLPSLFTSQDPYERGTVNELLNPPSWEHPFGTDDAARDIMSQVIYATRTSLFIGFVSAALAVIAGASVGLIAGYSRGRVGEFFMRLADLFLIIPLAPLMITLAAILGPNIWNVIMVISVTAWPSTSRVVRSTVLSIREKTHIERAVTIGCSDTRILLRHILPEVLPVIFATTIITITMSIKSEAFLSFLGLGDINVLSWGTILNHAVTSASFSRGAYWFFLPPGIFLMLIVFALTSVARGLEEIYNPKLRRL
jgi:peptide/nickel transport system permease protein